MDLATLAAFTAAGLTLVNVRITLRGQRTQWRRDTERPVIAKLLNLSAQCIGEFREAASLKQDWMNPSPGRANINELREQGHVRWLAGVATLDEVTLTANELDLLANGKVRASVEELLQQLQSMKHISRAPGGAQRPYDAVCDYERQALEIRHAIVSAGREDIGIDPRVPGKRQWKNLRERRQTNAGIKRLAKAVSRPLTSRSAFKDTR